MVDLNAISNGKFHTHTRPGGISFVVELDAEKEILVEALPNWVIPSSTPYFIVFVVDVLNKIINAFTYTY